MNPRFTPIGLEDFEVIRSLATGAFGNVMLVQHKTTKDQFAMKVLNKEKVIRKDSINHVHNEKKILHATSFPFIVELKFRFQDAINLYMVMEFVPGGEMFPILQRYGAFTEPHACFYASQVVLAIEYLHHMDVIYRDLKPENILIDNMGYIKVI